MEINLPLKFQVDTFYSFCVMLWKEYYKISESTGPSEAKFYVAPPWDRGKDGKLIQMI